MSPLVTMASFLATYISFVLTSGLVTMKSSVAAYITFVSTLGLVKKASFIVETTAATTGHVTGILDLSIEIRIQIYQDVFRGLVIELVVRLNNNGRSTLSNICCTCHRFSAEARPTIFESAKFLHGSLAVLTAKAGRLWPVIQHYGI